MTAVGGLRAIPSNGFVVDSLEGLFQGGSGLAEGIARPRVNNLRPMGSRAVSRDYGAGMRLWGRMYARAVRLAKEWAPDASSVLDAATGPGLILPRLLRAYPDAVVTALDISEEMLQRARETLDREALAGTVRLVRGSDYDMPFGEGVFDLVLATQTIHVLDDLPRFFSEVRRVLAPGGKLLVLDLKRDCPAWMRWICWASTGAIRIAGKNVDGMGPVIDACYTRIEVEDALRSAGMGSFEVLSGVVGLVVRAER